MSIGGSAGPELQIDGGSECIRDIERLMAHGVTDPIGKPVRNNEAG